MLIGWHCRRRRRQREIQSSNSEHSIKVCRAKWIQRMKSIKTEKNSSGHWTRPSHGWGVVGTRAVRKIILQRKNSLKLESKLDSISAHCWFQWNDVGDGGPHQMCRLFESIFSLPHMLHDLNLNCFSRHKCFVGGFFKNLFVQLWCCCYTHLSARSFYVLMSKCSKHGTAVDEILFSSTRAKCTINVPSPQVVGQLGTTGAFSLLTRVCVRPKKTPQIQFAYTPIWTFFSLITSFVICAVNFA